MLNSRVYSKSAQDTPAGTFDNLYIDMNGVIHPAFHPTSGLKPQSFQEVFTRLFLYLDRLISVIRPQKVLYLSIDGPAPRAKMNQQRYRRFRSVVDAQKSAIITREMRQAVVMHLQNRLNQPNLRNESDSADALEKIILELTNPMDVNRDQTDEGDDTPKDNLKDSNIITPGTEFMEKLSQAVMYYVSLRMNTHPDWKNLVVLVSDSSVPGEGEQKIFDYVREIRQFEDYNPNTSHVIHGLDADLVMLALLTHEPNFFVLREDVFDKERVDLQKPLGLFQVRPLRVKLAHTFRKLIIDLHLNFERILDDFIFLLYFMGNDFIPQIASIDINDSIDQMASEYIQYHLSCSDSSREFLTAPGGHVNISRLVHFIKTRLLVYEEAVMEMRFSKWELDSRSESITTFDTPKDPISNYVNQSFATHLTKKFSESADVHANDLFKELSEPHKEHIDQKAFHLPMNKKFSDRVKSCLPGWRQEYYRVKFRLSEDASDREVLNLRKNVAYEYLRAVVWVWNYYTKTDTLSWSWYFPHHFGPMFADFALLTEDDLDNLFDFDHGTPFHPFEQLLSVLPRKSLTALPQAYRDISLQKDMQQFFPSKFEIDLNGHSLRQAFKAIPLIPFIDHSILQKHTKKASKSLTPQERRRNTFGHPIIFFRAHHKKMYKIVKRATHAKNALSGNEDPPTFEEKLFFSYMKKNIAGYLYKMSDTHPLKDLVPKRKATVETPFVKERLFPSFKNQDVYTAIYYLPSLDKRKHGILPDFDFDTYPHLATSWFGKKNRHQREAKQFANLIHVQQQQKQLRIPAVESDSYENASATPFDSVPIPLAIPLENGASSPSEDTTVDQPPSKKRKLDAGVENLPQKVDQSVSNPTTASDSTKQPSKKEKVSQDNSDTESTDSNPFLFYDPGVHRQVVPHRSSTNHKNGLVRETLFGREGSAPQRFAFCERSQTFPRPFFEQQKKYHNVQNTQKGLRKIQAKKKMIEQRTRETHQFKTRHRNKAALQKAQFSSKKRKRIT